MIRAPFSGYFIRESINKKGTTGLPSLELRAAPLLGDVCLHQLVVHGGLAEDRGVMVDSLGRHRRSSQRSGRSFCRRELAAASNPSGNEGAAAHEGWRAIGALSPLLLSGVAMSIREAKARCRCFMYWIVCFAWV